MTDHHDFADHHDDFAHDPGSHDDLPLYDDGHHDALSQPDDDHYAWDDDAGAHDAHGHDAVDVPKSDLDHGSDPVADDAPQPHTDLADDGAGLTDPFPPQVDVGDLPEPVDGFPWIDADSLGSVDPATLHAALESIDPHELAEYAGIDLPPGADPWEALANSDDPATSALAKFWAQN